MSMGGDMNQRIGGRRFFIYRTCSRDGGSEVRVL